MPVVVAGIEVLHGSHIGWQDTENYLHQKAHLFPWEKESIVPVAAEDFVGTFIVAASLKL